MENYKKYDKLNYYLALFFSGIVYPFINLLLALVLKRLIDSGIARNVYELENAIFVCLLVCIFLAAAVFTSELTKNRFVNNFSKKYRRHIFNEIIASDLNEFSNNSTGDFLATMTNTVSTIEEKYIKSFFSIVSNSSLLLFSIIGMFMINWQLSIPVLIVSLVPIIVMSLLGGKMQAKQNLALTQQNAYVSKVKDAFSGFLVIKSFNIEKQISKEFQNGNDKRADSEFSLSELNNISVSISNFSGYLVFLVAYGLGMFMVINGNTSIGGVTAIVQLVNFIVMPLSKLGLEMNNKKAGLAASKTLNQLLEKVHNPVKDNSNYLKLNRFENEIKLTNVSFSYPQHGETGKRVLSHINLRIEKGKKYALVGMSGSGKTTLLKLLMRYYKLTEDGNISIDNVNINNINLSSLYKLINIVQQDVYIFDNSLAYNIMLGKSFTNKELNYAINKSGLRKLVDGNSKGVDLNVGENGKALSGGQKQRISIARALIRKTPILLMDEATSSLDQKNTTAIENAILEIKDLTSIVVTHKLNPNLLQKYDAIIFMKDGTVTEEGSYEELMKQKGDLYNLCSLTMTN